MYQNNEPELQKILNSYKKPKPSNWPGFAKIGVIIIVFVLFLLFFGKFFNILNGFSISPGLFFSFIINSGELKQDNDRTNFILLGTGGAAHEGSDLTDSMMFVSMNRKTGKTVIFSLPRDIWVPSLEQKINTLYVIGEKQKKGTGIDLTKKIISEMIGQPIHYGVVVNFNAFLDIIDLVGGVDVNVDKTFDDYKYPIEDNNYNAASISGEIYKHIHFDKGLIHMNGQTALEFARSRNSGDKEEGTDFARSKRQQKIILALKNKFLSREILTDLPKLQKSYKTFLDNIISFRISSRILLIEYITLS